MRNLAPGEKGTYWLKVKNVGTAAGDVVLFEADDTSELDFNWLRGKNDVTDNVQGAGFEFSLAKGKTKQFRFVVKVSLGAPDFGGNILHNFDDLDDDDGDGVRSGWSIEG